MRLDTVDKMTEQLDGTLAWGAWNPLVTRRSTTTMNDGVRWHRAAASR